MKITMLPVLALVAAVYAIEPSSIVSKATSLAESKASSDLASKVSGIPGASSVLSSVGANPTQVESAASKASSGLASATSNAPAATSKSAASRDTVGQLGFGVAVVVGLAAMV